MGLGSYRQAKMERADYEGFWGWHAPNPPLDSSCPAAAPSLSLKTTTLKGMSFAVIPSGTGILLEDGVGIAWTLGASLGSCHRLCVLSSSPESLTCIGCGSKKECRLHWHYTVIGFVGFYKIFWGFEFRVASGLQNLGHRALGLRLPCVGLVRK